MQMPVVRTCWVKSTHRQTPSYLPGHSGRSPLPNKSRTVPHNPDSRSFDMETMQNAVSGCGSQARMAGEFFNKLSPEAMKDLSSMAFASSYSPGMILFSEKDPAPGVYIILEGEVKLSMNSSDGRRLILRIARKGDILGLASALSGKPCEMTAETLYPAK